MKNQIFNEKIRRRRPTYSKTTINGTTIKLKQSKASKEIEQNIYYIEMKKTKQKLKIF